MSARRETVETAILNLLQDDAALSVDQVARKAGLSTSPCWRRIKSMEDDGLIVRRVAVLDRQALGMHVTVCCTLSLRSLSPDDVDAFEQAVCRWESVLQCARVSGSAHYELVIVACDMSGYDRFLRGQLLALGIVASLKTRIVLRTVKETTRLPLELVQVQPKRNAGRRRYPG